jgi:hypothetical protein
MTEVRSQISVIRNSDEKNRIRQNFFVFTLSALLFALCVPVWAQQQPSQIRWIGYLAGAGSGPHPALMQGLGELGYIEGKNIAFVYRTTEGTSDRNAELADELVRRNVDLIVVENSTAARAAKKATAVIPIVMTTATDPVGTGLVDSLARPGGNVTGLTSVTGELGGKFWNCSRKSFLDSPAWLFRRRRQARRRTCLSKKRSALPAR